MDTPLIHEVRAYVEGIYQHEFFHNLAFHNIQHTREVVESSIQIGTVTGLDEISMETLVVAAWLHDVGYKEAALNHEEISIKHALVLLTGLKVPEQRILQIVEAIRATKVPQQPKDLISRILCDADLHHLAKKDFIRYSDRLRQEWKFTLSRSMTDEDWVKVNVDFMKAHQYHTPYGKEILEPLKADNQKKLTELAEQDQDTSIPAKGKSKLPASRKALVDLMQTSLINAIIRVSLEELKAYLLIGISSMLIVLSLAIPAIMKRDGLNLQIPMLALDITCGVALLFAFLATKPFMPKMKNTKLDWNFKFMDLFAGRVSQATKQEDWTEVFKSIQGKPEIIRKSLIREIRHQGKLLNRKQLYLRISYNAILVGLGLALVSFIVAFV